MIRSFRLATAGALLLACRLSAATTLGRDCTLVPEGAPADAHVQLQIDKQGRIAAATISDSARARGAGRDAELALCPGHTKQA